MKKFLNTLIMLVSLSGCAGIYEPGGDHSLATSSKSMGPFDHAAASRGQPLPPNGF